jgi:polysaccharide pyruvyl transferase WcaK-like protein
MFGLIADYRNLVYAIIDLLMQRNNVIVVLIPHVLPPAGFEVESDFLASQQVYERYKEKYADRLFLVEGRFNHSEMKYIIGLCNFFIGSRMHSCIAAMSQNVPSVGLAYSPKFDGVFEAVGVVENVIDLRRTSQREVLDSLARAFDRRETTGAHLEQATPRIQQRILNMLTEAQHLID